MKGLCDDDAASPDPPTPIMLDSSSAIALESSFHDTGHTHHILRSFHYVRERVAKGTFTTPWIMLENQLANIKQTPGPCQ